MDKNYNVDDILSEIKSRKSKEKTGGQVPPSPRGAEPFPPAAQDSGPPEEFLLDLPPDPANKRSNPMEFTGHVQSIADKAKRRPSKLTGPGHRPAAQQQFQFSPVDEEEPQSPSPVSHNTIDFSAFKSAPGIQNEDGHTRILPGFPTSRDFDTGDMPKSRLLSPDDDPSYYEEELEEEIEQTPVDFSEYNSVEDRRDVATDIARVKLWLFIRTSVTLILTAILFYYALAGRHEAIPIFPSLYPEAETMRAYMIFNTVITSLVALINSSAIGGGLISLFKMRANSDTLASFALLAAIAQGVVGAIKPDTVTPQSLNLYFCIAALAMLFGALGKMTMINRIQTNFRILATDKKKKALLSVENDEFCREFVPEATRRPTIAYGVKADFFTDFLGLSYSDKYDVGINRAVAPVCLAGALVVGIVCYLLTETMLSAVSAFTAILCVTATLSATFIENIPLAKLTKKLAPQGGMVSGNKAVEDFCDTEALIFTENDLFPEGNIRLRGIKAFGQGRIDEAILDAASVICSLEGALSPVFLQMIGNNKKLLKKVDNVVFENAMGISAWVDSRRVLIGNRKLMQNHGIDLPPDAARHNVGESPEDGELLYLSNSGEVSAQFAVSYHIDDELAAQLDLLAARETVLIVHTCDANITPHRLWELYGYPEELIRVLPAERQVQYRQMTQPRESAIAEIVYTGRASTLVGAILACINARASILSATVIQLVQIVLGYGLVAFMAFMGAIDSLTIYQLCIYQLFWFLAIFVVQKIRQP